MRHGIQAECRGVVQHAVPVQRAALVAGVAQAQVAGDEVFLLGSLGRQVDGAARAAAATIGRIGPLDDFHGLDVEHFARAGRDVAYPVHVDAALGVAAADERAVAHGVAAFAGAEGDAGAQAQRVGQRGRAGLLDHLLRNHVHRLGRVDQRRRELALRGLLGLERIVYRCFHLDGGQRCLLLGNGGRAHQAQAGCNDDLCQLTVQAVAFNGMVGLVFGHASLEQPIGWIT